MTQDELILWYEEQARVMTQDALRLGASAAAGHILAEANEFRWKARRERELKDQKVEEK